MSPADALSHVNILSFEWFVSIYVGPRLSFLRSVFFSHSRLRMRKKREIERRGEPRAEQVILTRIGNVTDVQTDQSEMPIESGVKKRILFASVFRSANKSRSGERRLSQRSRGGLGEAEKPRRELRFAVFMYQRTIDAI